MTAVLDGPAAAYVAAGAAPVAGAAALLARSRRRLGRARTTELEERVRAQERQARQLTDSLRDLVSDLRVDEVLAKITLHAQTAVGGSQYALVLNVGGGEIACSHTSDLPAQITGALEAWAPSALKRSEGDPFVVEDIAAEPALAHLAGEGAERPVASMAVAPLVFKGERLGLLVALADQVQGFLPRDLGQLGSYAAQAAVAIANARLYEATETEASRDPLTGLFNHREFHEKLAQEVARCRRYGLRLSLVMMDLDGFKRVNDTAGHRAGDRLLHEVGAEVARGSRASDLPFRIGGDEFALLLPETGPTDAELLAARVRDAVARRDGRISISCGIASCPEDGNDKEEILRTADLALYAAKHGGGPAGAGRARRQPGMIRRAGEVERLRTGNETLRKQSRQLAVANRLGAKLARLVDAGEICETAVEEIDAEFGFLMCSIVRVSEDRTELVEVAGRGRAMDRLHDRGLRWRQPISAGVLGRVARSGEPALVQDVRQDPDFLGNAANRESAAELAVPIRVEGAIWGVLNLEEPIPGAFDEDDLAMANTVGEQIAAALHGAALYHDLESAYLATVSALSGALEAKDSYTAEHAREIADTAVATGERLGLGPEQLRALRYAALLHDIGKIAVPEEILNKPGPLSPEEMAVAQRHVTAGEEIIAHVPFLGQVRSIVLHAHERWDGTGYPAGLKGTRIPIGARIVFVADAYHAMTSNRAYRAAMRPEQAAAELRDCAGSQFDPDVVDAFLAMVEETRQSVDTRI